MANLGSFAERMLIHENSVVKVGPEVPFEQLALIGCGVTTGVGAVLNTAKVEPGSTVAVIGCGGVGLSCVQGARLAGALRIIAIDAVETKLAMALEFGATDVVDASAGGVVQKVFDLTGGGVDYSFEAIGNKRDDRAVIRDATAGRNGHDHRDDTRRDQDRAGRQLVPAGAQDTGLQHGLQPVPH